MTACMVSTHTVRGMVGGELLVVGLPKQVIGNAAIQLAAIILVQVITAGLGQFHV